MLVFAHGIGEHCCRPGYVELFGPLSDAGVDVRSMDHHGHGTDDRVTSASASLDFFRNIGSTRKRYLRLRGFFHELFEEPRTEEEVVKSIRVFASAGGGAFAVIAGEGEEGGGY